MRTKILIFIFLFSSISFAKLKAQDLSGSYSVSGYFFHPTAPRDINLRKTITKVGVNTYQLDYVGDLAGWGFQFTVNNTNHLVNWVATGATYPAPQSGFMTADNPGGFIYSGPPYPGTEPWIHSIYNNTYDPATQAFYMHYGYMPGAADQNGYTRQIYEKYDLLPSVKITSATPLSGTAFTKVTIKGKKFLNVDPGYSVYFGNAVADSVSIISDSKMIAWVGSGASGNISVTNKYYSSDTFPNFVYTPVPPVTNSQWSYVGKKGFSEYKAYSVCAASGSNNIPYVAFIDSASRKVKSMKYNGNKWVSVGSSVSDGTSNFTTIVLTDNNIPIIAYTDSTAGGNITVKKFSSGDWVRMGKKGFAPAASSSTPFSLAIDNANTLYILSFSSDSISVFKFDGTNWIGVGAKGFAVSANSQADVSIDKTSNTPYVIFDDVNAVSPSGNYQATVMKFNDTKWVTVGNAGFTNGKIGVFYPDIEVDGAGNVLASMQEDDGFERQSVYQFKSGDWTPVGYPRFSKGRSYYNSLSIDKKNNLYALFYDASYNKQGTVMKYVKKTGTWDTAGARGFIPFATSLERKSLFFDTSNTPMVAFSDKNNGGKISVLKYDVIPNLISEQYNANNAELIQAVKIYPNPATNIATIEFKSNKPGKYIIEISDISGRVMQTVKVLATAGENKVSIDVSKYVPGNYLISLTNNTNEKQMLKLDKR